MIARQASSVRPFGFLPFRNAVIFAVESDVRTVAAVEYLQPGLLGKNLDRLLHPFVLNPLLFDQLDCTRQLDRIGIVGFGQRH